MFPRVSFDDVPYLRRSDTISGSQFLGRYGATLGEFTDGEHLLGGQFRTPRPLALAGITSVLANHIPNVIALGAKKQVTNASTHVARVQDLHPIWDRTVLQFPANSMRQVIPLHNREASISVAVGSSSPEPAITGPVNLGPKPFCHRNHFPWWGAFTSYVVSMHKAARLSLYRACLAISDSGKRGRRTTATLTEFRGTNVEGKLNRGWYTVHVNPFLRRVGHSPAVCSGAGVCYA